MNSYTKRSRGFLKYKIGQSAHKTLTAFEFQFHMVSDITLYIAIGVSRDLVLKNFYLFDDK